MIVEEFGGGQPTWTSPSLPGRVESPPQFESGLLVDGLISGTARESLLQLGYGD